MMKSYENEKIEIVLKYRLAAVARPWLDFIGEVDKSFMILVALLKLQLIKDYSFLSNLHCFYSKVMFDRKLFSSVSAEIV